MTDVLLDTHCHLDAFANPSQVLAAAAAADVQVVAVTNTPDDYRRMATLLPRGGAARAALGLHPLHAHRLGMGGVLRFSRHAAGAAWIGEIGLDFSPAGRDTRDAQLKTFDALLALPQLRDRPVTVHTRGADKIAVQRLVDARIRAVLHWYTGPLGVADEALAAGLHFSVNPSMLASAKGRTLLARIPQDRVLCETDGPFARRSGHPCQPADLPAMIEELAVLWHVSAAHARTQICANQRRITDEKAASPA
ncbi:TatD family hydrolase [Actinoplanes rectilineatus]|uniref:TatD family hydrolase n=1 Tax=Actinoplanes rectilineatus TaxID=113571 RepID=UPI0005F2F02F|nr:TatD family hydrolase [Actinoplanes rectilineatus]